MTPATVVAFFRTPTLGRSVLVLLSVAFLALLGANVTTFLMMRHTGELNELVEHTHQVRGAVHQLRVAALEAENGQRGVLLTGEIYYLSIHDQAVARTPTLLDELEGLTRDNPVQQARVNRLRDLFQRRYAIIQRGLDMYRAGRREAAVGVLRSGDGRRLSAEIRAELRAADEAEQILLRTRSEESKAEAARAAGVNALGGLLILLAAIISLLLFRRYIAELQASREKLDHLNRGLERRVDERTEALTRANEEIQRFAYIVSHDLRAPLVNVMGYTSELQAASKALERQVSVLEERAPETLDPEAVQAVREDVPEAIGFIRASTAKMDSLINAILKLSREGRRTLNVELVNMTAAVQAIADSVRHQTEAQGAEIRVEMLPQIESDRLSLDQIFGNLIDNAVKYLDPARPGVIVVRGAPEGPDVVRYEVEDNGRGIAPRDHERVFELFRRAGVQDRTGEGLGLAFVKNSVRRLGGTIELRSALGKGSTFILKFPKRLLVDRGDAA
ncbi:MAG TPA: CHASE3 domain-containing protein [Caulobacteraceae bacterium]|nr:CHASE3 domain-containing protein [Caulobacteraceae bacterium]